MWLVLYKAIYFIGICLEQLCVCIEFINTNKQVQHLS